MKFKYYDDGALRRQLAGDGFTVIYRIRGTEQEALETAKSMCVEQTVEFPAQHIECPAILDGVLGHIDYTQDLKNGWHRVNIVYTAGTAGADFPQLLNVAFGNSSIFPDVTLERICLPDSMKKTFPGPKFGVQGMRERLGVYDRPFTFTALKPMGLPPEALAEEAYRCALGGIDLIKDDHGLMDQPFAPFRERVERAAAAVRRANEETGGHTAYIPNVSGSFRRMDDRLRLAVDCGCGGVMVAPGLAGFDLIGYAAEKTGLPVVCHPAFLGGMLDRGRGGVDCACLLGQLPRLAGADITVFPNFGGRFSLSEEQCAGIRDMASEDQGAIRPILPSPAGGMTFDKVAPMREFYGNDTALLMGGGLFTAPGTLTENCQRFLHELQ